MHTAVAPQNSLCIEYEHVHESPKGIMRPSLLPARPYFSSGPCAKRPSWTHEVLHDAVLGRSHRSEVGHDRLRALLTLSRDLLGLPEDYRIAVVPGSDTGAVEMALWSLLGARGVDCLAWESFGLGWVEDIRSALKIEDLRVFKADYGELPDLAQVDWRRDVVFTWNGTTSGVCVPDGAWITDDREGLAICDATSAVFAMDLPWPKLDVATYSWQKVLGGEAAHGMLILSPRAVARLESHTPPWPIPKVFRLTKKGRLTEDLFTGATINTPSLLCVEDHLDALRWARSLGGLQALIARSSANLAVIGQWVQRTPWVDFLAADPRTRSSTSVCLKIVDPWFTAQSLEERWAIVRALCARLEEEQAAYDIAAYRDAPPGLRIWCGATVERADVERLLPWLDWAYHDMAR
ncbi:MAG: Phosphoserine aminotransferase [Gammaproteobacteria bacterium]|nr:Phosphoserine aminotransferase [Gammaproteobacteria bacterium]